MTYTLITTVETATMTVGYPAVKGLTGDQIQGEKNRIRESVANRGDTIDFRVIADN
jgi:hypothetical protein